MTKVTKGILSSLWLILGISLNAVALEPGQAAPEFKLQDQNGNWISLEQYRGKWVALYFYPKDDTPGCTKEACAFRDNIFAFDEINAVVMGVSLDNIESHAKFALFDSCRYRQEHSQSLWCLRKDRWFRDGEAAVLYHRPRR